MSWSILFIGKPENVIAALEKNSESLTGQSKAEYEKALPHMVGLVKENFSNVTPPIVAITAAGHGYSENGEMKQSQCTCNIEVMYGQLV